MPTTHTAQAGDSLCSIAYSNGFGDCQPLRSEPANAFILNRAQDPAQLLPGDVVTIPDKQSKVEQGSTDQRHNFVRRGRLASIRFVHGTPNLSVENDPTITELNVSNYITNRAANPDGSAAFPGDGVRGFNAAANQDIDTFKVEVMDIKASGNLQVDLEMLRPTYNAAGAVTGHTQFPSAIRANRELKNVVVEKQGSTKRFRSCYLRLVVDDDQDKAAAPTQTLLASDMHDAGDSQVEILDQLVKASYTIPTCPANPKCKAQVKAPIGHDRRRIRLSVHVLRNAPGGALIVNLADVRRRVFTWFRRVYAQAGIAPKLVVVQAIDPPENLVAISDDQGAVAVGTERLRFRINAAGHPSQVIGPITPNAGDTPVTTANALAALITAPYQAAVSENAARLDALSDNTKSCDIVITATDGTRVTIDQVLSPAAGHTLTVGRVNALNVPRASFNFSGLIGTIEQRALFKNFDTKLNNDDDTVDVFVAQTVTRAEDGNGVRGTATISGHRVNANRAAVSKVKCSVLMTQLTIDSTNNNPFTFPHEFGHVAGETGHAQAAPAQLMTSGTTGNNAVAGTKRIRDSAVTYDLVAGNFNLIDRIRAESAALLENW